MSSNPGCTSYLESRRTGSRRFGGALLNRSAAARVRLWDRKGTAAAVLRGHAGPAVTAHFSPHGDRILTASSDHTARVWLARGGDLLGLADRRITRELSTEERELFGDLLGTGE